LRETLRPQERAGGGGYTERPGVAVIRGAQDSVAARAHRSRYGVLRAARAPRVRAVLGGGKHRSQPDEGATPADQRDLRTFSSHHSGRVLRYRVSQEAVHEFRGAADRPGRVARRVQPDTPALWQILLRQNAFADVPGFAFAGSGENTRRQL